MLLIEAAPALCITLILRTDAYDGGLRDKEGATLHRSPQAPPAALPRISQGCLRISHISPTRCARSVRFFYRFFILVRKSLMCTSVQLLEPRFPFLIFRYFFIARRENKSRKCVSLFFSLFMNLFFFFGFLRKLAKA